MSTRHHDPRPSSPALSRRSALLSLAGLGAALGGCQKDSSPMSKTTSTPLSARMPAIFLAHGSPMLLDDQGWVDDLARWAAALPRPKAVLVVSAHWERSPITIGATSTVPLYYDFYGFPRRYYDITYPSPGAPQLAERVKALLSSQGPVASDPARGLDHGAYIPLMAMYPKADLPVLQVSMPSQDTRALLAMGKALSPLRDEGVLIMTSGFLTHNLRAFDPNPSAKPPSWASDLDAWCADVLTRRDVDALLDYRARAPGVRQALPTHEHFVPVVVAMGADVEAPSRVSFPIEGFTYGSFTRRSMQLG